MRTWCAWATTMLAVAVVGACDPYSDFARGNGSLGAVDPVGFPAENLGAGGNRKNPGRGTFTEIAAFAGGVEIGYFRYPVREADNPLWVRVNGERADVEAPRAYVFDPGLEPIPQAYACTAPAGYIYDSVYDEVRYDLQGAIFTQLPEATYREGVQSGSSYVPVVSQVPVDSTGLGCQEVTSEDGLVSIYGLAGPDELAADGRYLAWLIIEPSAAVYPRGQSSRTDHPGLGLQHWGWFNRYLLAYLDGGYIPTVDLPQPDGRIATQMATQRLYYPRSAILRDPNDPASARPGRLGEGYDVLQARRGQPGYSPVCEVFSYDADRNPMLDLPVTADRLPKDALSIESDPGYAIEPAVPGYSYCLQVQR